MLSYAYKDYVMNVNAINSAMNLSGCQPIRNQSFSHSMPPNYSINDTENEDVFTPADPYTQEQKFELACRLAALYATKYKELQQKTGCYA